MGKMRVVWYIVISAIFIGVSCSKQPQLHLGPRIKFDETEIDFGEIAQSKKITHIFKFENIGGDTLIIEKVHAP